jgi:DNA-binding CsgD family transcriptional regulator
VSSAYAVTVTRANREVDVLRLAAQGLTTAEIAARLYISPKTADHHIQHVYTKIGVSTRGASAWWAMQNSLVG